MSYLPTFADAGVSLPNGGCSWTRTGFGTGGLGVPISYPSCLLRMWSAGSTWTPCPGGRIKSAGSRVNNATVSVSGNAHQPRAGVQSAGRSVTTFHFDTSDQRFGDHPGQHFRGRQRRQLLDMEPLQKPTSPRDALTCCYAFGTS